MDVFGWNCNPFEILNIDPHFDFWYPYAEIETRYVLNEILPADANIIDVGANVGLISIALAIDKPHRKILAIEPSQIHAENLRLNTRHLHLKNIFIISNPLSYRAGKLKSKIWESNRISRIDPEYPFITLDQAFIDWGQSKVNLIKIDTDGYEFRILLGARKLLRSTDALWSIEQTTSASLFSRLIINMFTCFYGYKLITKLDGENAIYVKKQAFREFQDLISKVIKNVHGISIQDYSSDGLTLNIYPSDFRRDSNATNKFHLSNVGFKYRGIKNHTNILSLSVEVEPSALYLKLPFILEEGSINVVIQDLETNSYYSREVYAHEEVPILFPLKKSGGRFLRVAVRTGLSRNGSAKWVL